MHSTSLPQSSRPMQQCIVITAAGGPETLALRQRPIPLPASGEVLVRVEAAGVNRHDCNQRSRGPNANQSDIPGLEVAGIVESVGDGVTTIKPGARVCALVDGGGYAEFAIAAAPLVLPISDSLDMVGAASLPEAAFTAWYNLFGVAALKPGESVLIHGGTSGVGVFAIQMLRALGHPVFATCGTDEKCAAAEALGANLALNYTKEKFDSSVTRRIGRDIDVVLDMSGGAHTLASLDALAYRGRIIHLSSGGNAQFQAPLSLIMRKECRISGSLMRPLPLPDKTIVAGALRERMWPHLGSAIRPQIAHVLALGDAAHAHTLMEQGRHIGKIVLQMK